MKSRIVAAILLLSIPLAAPGGWNDGPASPVVALGQAEVVAGYQLDALDRTQRMEGERLVFTYRGADWATAISPDLTIEATGPLGNFFSVEYRFPVAAWQASRFTLLTNLGRLLDGAFASRFPIVFAPELPRESADSAERIRFADDLIAEAIRLDGDSIAAATESRRLSAQVVDREVVIRVEVVEREGAPNVAPTLADLDSGEAHQLAQPGVLIESDGESTTLPAGVWIRADFVRRDGEAVVVEGEARTSDGRPIGSGRIEL